LKNVWLGVSVENQERADERIPWLLSTSAAKRFISYEPALGAIDLTRYEPFCKLRGGAWSTAGKLARILDGKIDWVIMGAESGRQARPMNEDWARLVRGQCWATEVPFFLKQMWVDGKLAKMPALDGKTWSQIPEG
jgi:protein gp37